MINLLFLTSVMKKGHGVSVVIHALKEELISSGYNVFIASQDTDDSEFNKSIFQVDSNASSISELAQKLHADVIIAVTSPFFELLPELSQKYRVIAYEHGDPTPELFSLDSKLRKEICYNKQQNVYKYLDAVVVISEFIKSDINFDSSTVIYNGINHVPDLGEKNLNYFLNNSTDPLRIGTLMRIGPGEAYYKGNELFIQIVNNLKIIGNFEFFVMGKGSKEDAESFASNGIKVFLNSTDTERNNYLRNLDIFISPSLWEGFNLPLVESQALGTLSLAFDTGAHPEVTPFVYGSIHEMIQNIRNWDANRIQLHLNSQKCYQFARHKFNWKTAASEFSRVIEQVLVSNSRDLDLSRAVQIFERKRKKILVNSKIRRAFRYLAKKGFRATLLKIFETFARSRKPGR